MIEVQRAEHYISKGRSFVYVDDEIYHQHCTVFLYRWMDVNVRYALRVALALVMAYGDDLLLSLEEMYGVDGRDLEWLNNFDQ